MHVLHRVCWSNKIVLFFVVADYVILHCGVVKKKLFIKFGSVFTMCEYYGKDTSFKLVRFS